MIIFYIEINTKRDFKTRALPVNDINIADKAMEKEEKEFVKKLIEKIRTKKYRNIDDKILLEKINEFLGRNKKIKEKLSKANEKSKEFKEVVKCVKQEMHRIYGAFQNDIGKREKLLEKLEKAEPNSNEFIEIHKKILLTHKSTAERLRIYDNLYNDLFSITGKPDIVVDIGCGMNPFSLPWMKVDGMYLAVEFNRKDADFIRKYFSIIKRTRKGIFEALELDVAKENDYAKLRNIPCDVAFAWKMFDILDFKTAENIIKSINAKYLVASFSTKTLGKRQMNFPRRSSFQKMLRRLGLEYKTLSYENEIFYIIKLKDGPL